MIFNSTFNEIEVISDVKISFDKRITELERHLIKKIIEKYEEDISVKMIKIKKDDLLGIIKTSDISDNSMQDFFSKLMKKQVNYSFIINGGEKVYKGFFPIITSIIFNDDFIVIKLSDEIISGFKKNTIFMKIGIISILKFEIPYSMPLFLYILSHCLESKGKVSFTLGEFKDLLNTGESYDRFYDFEKKVIIPILSDINSKTYFELSLFKVKTGISKTSRIIGIDIEYKNSILDKREKDTEKLYFIVKDKIKDYQHIKNLIYIALDSYDYSKIYNIILDSQKGLKKNIETYIIDNLPIIKKDIIAFDENQMKNDIVVEKYISSFYELHSEVNKALVAIGVGSDHASDLVTYKKLCIMKPEEEFSVTSGEYQLTVFYSLKRKSKITIKKI